MGTASEADTTNFTDRGGNFGPAIRKSARPEPETTQSYQQMADDSLGTGGQGLANFLGFFSLGLGFAEFAMPGVVAKIAGINSDSHSVMRAMGAREMAHGVSVLSSAQPGKQLWGRVAGDALDLALLGGALLNSKNSRGRTLFATGAVLGVTVLDILAAKQLSEQPTGSKTVREQEQGLVVAKRSITVARPIEEVYAFWRDFQNFPRFMRHLESVTVTDPTHSHWVAKGPAGKSVEWDAEITDERENELISWRSLPGADVPNSGTVRFQKAPADRGTEVHVQLSYDPPLGKLGAKVAALFREAPGQQITDDMRHFKQIMEIGDIVVSDSTKQRGMHPAQPDHEPVQL
jgi:uncharacterized membrane protein